MKERDPLETAYNSVFQDRIPKPITVFQRFLDFLITFLVMIRNK